MTTLPDIDMTRLPVPTPGAGISLLASTDYYCDRQFLTKIACEYQSRGFHSEVAVPASPDRGIRRLWTPSSSARWLAQRLSTSEAAAQSLIDRIPIYIHPKLGWNAANPRNLLGLEVALQKSPDVLIYSCEGMDPQGVNVFHDYLASRHASHFGIHVNWNCDPSKSDSDYQSPNYYTTEWLDAYGANKSCLLTGHKPFNFTPFSIQSLP